MSETVTIERRISSPATLLKDAAERFGEQAALRFLGAEISFRKLQSMAEDSAAMLRAMGAGEGTRILLMAPNSPAFVAAYFGALKLGCTVTPVNPAAPLPELSYICRDSGAELAAGVNLKAVSGKLRALLADPENKLRAAALYDFSAPMTPLKRLLLRATQRKIFDSDVSDPAVLRAETAPRAAGEDAPEQPGRPALLQYTGGTTGKQKGALLSCGALAVNTAQCAERLGAPEGRHSAAAILPFFHIFSLTAVLHMSLRQGFTVQLYPRPDIPALLRDIHTGNVTILAGVPALFAKIAAHPYAGRCRFDKLTFCVSGGAPLSSGLKERFEKLTGRPMAEGYGLTEASPVLSFTAPVREETNRNCAGRPLTDTLLRVHGPEGEILPPGTPGEIRAKGPQLMTGYCGAASEEEHVFDEDGFLRTGDMGYLDEDGFLHVSGRLKELIIVSGFKVYPREVEEALSRIPGVYEAAVFGEEDEETGQRVVACVQLAEGARENADSLRDALKEKLMYYKVPKIILFLPSLPKTAVGKTDKNALIEKARERL